jgi:hypothetical protein
MGGTAFVLWSVMLHEKRTSRATTALRPLRPRRPTRLGVDARAFTYLEVWAMSLKYINNLLLVLAGGFLAVASRTFSPDVAGWLGLGVGVLAVVLAGVGLALDRPQWRSVGSAVTGLVGVWTIVSSTVFSGTTLGWLVFADALALAAIALGELTAHERSTERVVHTLVVAERQPQAL